MDFNHFLFDEKSITAIGWTLAHSIWQIALISGLLWLVLTAIPKKAAEQRYAVALLALGAVFAASCWTFVGQMNELMESQPQDFLRVQMNQSSTEALVYFPRGSDRLDEPVAMTSLANRMEGFLPFLVNLWVLGVIFYSVRLAGSIYDLQALHRRHQELVSKTLLRKVDSLSAAMGLYQKVQVLKSTLVRSPVTYGFIKPVILLPASLVFSVSPAHLEAIIAHELAHIKRNDYLVNLLQSIMEVIFFFHPCFWWINQLINEERENAADDLALAAGISSYDLAHGLAEAANYSNSIAPDMALAASENKHKTLRRIKRIMGKSMSSPKPSPLIPITMIFALIISAIFLAGAQEEGSKNDDLLLTHIKTHTMPWEKPIGARLSHKRMIVIQDTIPSKKQSKASDLEEMPVLNLTPVPQLEAEVPPMPELPLVPPVPFEDFDFPQFDIHIEADSLAELAMELHELEGNDSPEAQDRRKALQAAMEKVQANINTLSKVFEEKIADWHTEHGDSFKKYEQEMKVWEEKMKETQKSWQSSFGPKMKEFEEKMKLWEEENAPKIKEFEEKIKQWMEENEEGFKVL